MNMQETEVWQDSIYLIDINDPVQGGENGVDNLPHKQLASRTRFLKNKIDEQEIKINELQNTIQSLKNTDNSGLQSQIDSLKEQIAEIVANNSTRKPIAAFDINLSTYYRDKDGSQAWGMRVSTEKRIGDFVPVVDGKHASGVSYKYATVTIPDWVTDSSQVLITIVDKKVDNAEAYIVLDIDNHRINISPVEEVFVHPASIINVALYR